MFSLFSLDLLMETALDSGDLLVAKIIRSIAAHDGPTQDMFIVSYLISILYFSVVTHICYVNLVKFVLVVICWGVWISRLVVVTVIVVNIHSYIQLKSRCIEIL